MSYQFKFDGTYEHYNSSNKKSNHFIFPNNIGHINIYKEDISDDIYLVKENIQSYVDLEIITDNTFDTCMYMTIALQDTSLSYDYTTNKEVNHLKNGIVIEYKSQSKKSFMMAKDTQTKGIGLTITKSFLEENLFSYLKDKKRIEIERNYKNNITTLFKSSLASLKTLTLTKEIYNSPFNGVLNNLYIQSRVYEIIHNEFLSIINEKDKKSHENKMILTQDDIEALHKIRALILKDKKNFSIDELAKKAAINQTKLKYGFKKLFNTTLGNMILETKMYEAKRLLETSEYNVTQIAHITGYKYVQNFSNAFIKFFGQNPKDLMKSRNYYY